MFAARYESGWYTQFCTIIDSDRCLKKCSSFIIDTGAQYTSCNYRSINKNLCEDEFRKCSQAMCFTGYVKGHSDAGAIHYLYRLDQFYVGTIPLGSQNIWITFDQRVNNNLLGLDLLKQVSFVQLGHTDELYFLNNRTELQNIV